MSVSMVQNPELPLQVNKGNNSKIQLCKLCTVIKLYFVMSKQVKKRVE